MQKQKKLIILIIIIIVIVLMCTIITLNTIKQKNVKEYYYAYETYQVENNAEHYSKKEFIELIENEKNYQNYLFVNNIDLDKDTLEKISEKDFDNFNYILVFVPTNSCNEKIKFEDVEIEKNNAFAQLNFKAEETCGTCILQYEIYEIAVPKYVDKKYEIKTNWDIKEGDCDPIVAFKPILYLYPKTKTNIKINFANEDNLTTTYPKFKEEWNVIAHPNGDLYDDNKYYYALYWEEKTYSKIDFTEGFNVSSYNAINFLEEKLTILGLNPKERNEFIMYWLPILENNEHNLVYFELTNELQKQNKLIITPKPDTLIRIRLHVKKADKETNIKEQQLVKQERTGYTVVEWGGVIHN